MNFYEHCCLFIIYFVCNMTQPHTWILQAQVKQGAWQRTEEESSFVKALEWFGIIWKLRYNRFVSRSCKFQFFSSTFYNNQKWIQAGQSLEVLQSFQSVEILLKSAHILHTNYCIIWFIYFPCSSTDLHVWLVTCIRVVNKLHTIFLA